MMTWVLKLCALCAMSTLMQMALPDQDAKGSVRMICGLLMLKLTVTTAADFCAMIQGNADISEILSSLMG